MGCVISVAERFSFSCPIYSPSRYKLVTRDMGPYTRCAGTDVPPPQEFQLPLPQSSGDTPSLSDASDDIERILSQDPTYASLFVTLAYRCAASFRSTDMAGGCNGARIRFPPQSEWEVNTGLAGVRICVAFSAMITPWSWNGRPHTLSAAPSSVRI